LEPSGVRPPPKPLKPQPSTIQAEPWRIHRRVNFTTTPDTPVQTLPSLKTKQSSSGQPHMRIGTTCLDSIKQAIPSKSAPNQWATTPQHHEDPTQLHESSGHQRNMQNNIEPAPPSQIWPNNLISILQRIMATSCPPPTKPFFKFDPAINAASKNYILLKHTFGGDLQRALDTQPNLPLQYGSKFRTIETLESIFEHHPSWNRMKTVFTFGSSWPLAPLDKPE
jgi:hypothetical protein